ncbi:MAG: hypothetical protein AAB389_02325 [Patescibacteria group bacterium]
MKIKIPQWLASFLKGAGSVLEIWPTPQPTYEQRFGTDEERMASDWQRVGDDLQKAMDDVGEDIEGEKPNV